MVAQTGANKTVKIQQEVFKEICSTLKQYRYETGGIVATDDNGVICKFCMDRITTPGLFEYVPDTAFLSEVINGDWQRQKLTFAGFVHSHPDNDIISSGDMAYGREILKVNRSLSRILIGVIDVSSDEDSIKWTFVGLDSAEDSATETV
ncbi:MAG: hypothetical protein Q4G23_04215 [Clostridia bacterium]|nr:hypothetical protein [Clostridia bacterium]